MQGLATAGAHISVVLTTQGEYLMQKNVSPMVAIVVILVLLAVVAFVWMKYTAAPQPTAGGPAARGRRGGGRGAATEERGGRGQRGERGGERGGRQGARTGPGSRSPRGAAGRATEVPARAPARGR
jgi:hypothetical protein